MKIKYYKPIYIFYRHLNLIFELLGEIWREWWLEGVWCWWTGARVWNKCVGLEYKMATIWIRKSNALAKSICICVDIRFHLKTLCLNLTVNIFSKYFLTTPVRIGTWEWLKQQRHGGGGNVTITVAFEKNLSK